jgi:hypothetical protein
MPVQRVSLQCLHQDAPGFACNDATPVTSIGGLWPVCDLIANDEKRPAGDAPDNAKLAAPSKRSSDLPLVRRATT